MQQHKTVVPLTSTHLVVTPGTFRREVISPPREDCRPSPCIAMNRVVKHPPIIKTQIDHERAMQIEQDLRAEELEMKKILSRRDQELREEKSRLENLASQRIAEQIKNIELSKIEQSQKIQLLDQEAKEGLSRRRLELEKSLASSISSKKPLGNRPSSISGKEIPSNRDPLPRIILVDRTSEAPVNFRLPATLSRTLIPSTVLPDAPILLKPKKISQNIQTEVSFELGGGFHSTASGPINSIIRKRLLTTPSAPAKRKNCEKERVQVEKPNQPSVIDRGVKEILPVLLPLEPYVPLSSRLNVKPTEPSRISRPVQIKEFQPELSTHRPRDEHGIKGSFNSTPLKHFTFSKNDIRDSYPITQPETPPMMSIYRDQADGYDGSVRKLDIDYLPPRASSSNWKRNTASSPFIRKTPERSTQAYLNSTSDHRPTQSERVPDPRWLASHHTMHNRVNTGNGRRELSPKFSKTGDQKRFEAWMDQNGLQNEAPVSWPLYQAFLQHEAATMGREEDPRADQIYHRMSSRKNSRITENQGFIEKNDDCSKNRGQSRGYTFSKDRTGRMPEIYGNEVNCGLRIKRLPTYETKNLKELADKRKLDAWRNSTNRDYDKIGKMIAKAEFHDAQIYNAKVEENANLRRAHETDEERLNRIAWECSGQNLFSEKDQSRLVTQYPLATHGPLPISHSTGRMVYPGQSRRSKHELEGFDESYGILQTNGGKIMTFFCEKYGMSK